MEDASCDHGYCDHIVYDPFAQHYNSSICENPVTVITFFSFKVIILSGFQCITLMIQIIDLI